MSRMLATMAIGSLLVAQGALAAPSNRIEGVKITQSEGRVDVVLRTSAAPTFQSFAKRSPAVVIVDVIDAAAVAQKLSPPDGSVLESVDLAPRSSAEGDVARLTLRFSSAVHYDVTASGTAVMVSIFDDKSATPTNTKVPLKDDGKKVASLTSRDTRTDFTRTDFPSPRLAQADEEGSAGMSTGDSGAQRAMTYVGFRNTGTSSEVFARLNGTATYEVKREGQNLLVLEIKNATIPLSNNKNHLDATFFDSPVKMVTPTEVDDATPTIRIIIEMKEDVPYRQEVRGKEITVVFQKS